MHSRFEDHERSGVGKLKAVSGPLNNLIWPTKLEKIIFDNPF